MVTKVTQDMLHDDISFDSPGSLDCLTINPNMKIFQRRAHTTEAIVSPANSAYLLDRFYWGKTGTSADVTVRWETVDVPPGHTHAMEIDVTTADATVDAGDLIFVGQRIGGDVAARLALGTANVMPITIQFWMKTSVAGTYCFGLHNAAQDRTYRKEFTIDAVDTWQKVTLQITPDSSGVWVRDNSNYGLAAMITLMSGSTYQGTEDTWESGVVTVGTAN